MKNKILLISLLVVLMGFVGCKNEEDPIFKKTVKERVGGEIDRIKTQLLSDDGYWKLTYTNEFLPDSYVFLMQFVDEENVWMFTKLNEEYVKNSWRVNAEEGILLSFDTYGLLHVFADPANREPGKGYLGEYEFVIENTDDNNFYTWGRKYKEKFVFEKSSKADWDQLNLEMDLEDSLFDLEKGNITKTHYDEEGNPLITLFFDPIKKALSAYYYENFNQDEKFAYIPIINYSGDIEGLKLLGDAFVVNGQVINKLLFVDGKTDVMTSDVGSYKFVSGGVPCTFPGAMKDYIHMWIETEIINCSAAMQPAFDQLMEDVPRIQQVFLSPDFQDSPCIGIKSFKGKNGFYGGIEFEEDAFLGDENNQDVMRLVPTGEIKYFELFHNAELDARYKELLSSEGLKFIYEKLDEEGKGSSIIPVKGNMFYIVSRHNPKYWILVHKKDY